MVLYELEDVAEVTGLPHSLIKNWTIGRPFAIRPSFPAHGTGSRNLYSDENIREFATIYELLQYGLSVATVKILMSKIYTRSVKE